MSEQKAPQNEIKNPKRKSLLVTLLLVSILICLLITGYFVIRTILGVQRSSDALRDFPAEVVQQVEDMINPTPTITIDPVTIIKQVQALSRLETASYTIEKVITAQAGGEDVFSALLFGDRLLLVAQGQVIAGVDLGRLSENDIRIVGTTAYITIPAAEIFVATLDNENTYVYDRQTGLLGQQVDLETQARQEAEQAILEAALEDGILAMAQQNAEAYVRGLILVLGPEEVVFITATPSPDQTHTP